MKKKPDPVEVLPYLDEISRKSDDIYPEGGLIYKYCLCNSVSVLNIEAVDINVILSGNERLLEIDEKDYLYVLFENILVTPFPISVSQETKDLVDLFISIIRGTYKPTFMKIYDRYKDVHSKSCRLIYASKGSYASLDLRWSYD